MGDGLAAPPARPAPSALDPSPLLGNKLLGPALNGVALAGPAEDWPGEASMRSGTEAGALRDAASGVSEDTGASVSTPDCAGPVAAVPVWGIWANAAAGARTRAITRAFTGDSLCIAETPEAGHRLIEKSPFFRLLLLVNLTARPFSRLYERRFRLTLVEWRVVLTLADRPGISATELGEALGLDKMAISRAARSLEAAGRLARTPDSHDMRRATLDLTEAGRALHALIGPSARAREESLLSALDGQERAALDAILDKLVARARAMPEPIPNPS